MKNDIPKSENGSLKMKFGIPKNEKMAPGKIKLAPRKMKFGIPNMKKMASLKTEIGSLKNEICHPKKCKKWHSEK